MPVVVGRLHMPMQPGLGFALDWDRVQARTEHVVSAAATRAGSYRRGRGYPPVKA